MKDLSTDIVNRSVDNGRSPSSCDGMVPPSRAPTRWGERGLPPQPFASAAGAAGGCGLQDAAGCRHGIPGIKNADMTHDATAQTSPGGASVMDRLLAFLRANGADFEVRTHAPVRTSQEAARARGTLLEQGAKALVFQADDRTVLLVVQAHRRVDTRAFKRAVGVKNLRMVSAEDLKALTSLEVGAVPPFGHLLGLQTYV